MKHIKERACSGGEIGKAEPPENEEQQDHVDQMAGLQHHYPGLVIQLEDTAHVTVIEVADWTEVAVRQLRRQNLLDEIAVADYSRPAHLVQVVVGEIGLVGLTICEQE